MTTKREKATIATSTGEKYPIPSPPLKPFWQISDLTLDEVSEAMGTVTLGIGSLKDIGAGLKGALAGEPQTPRLDFASADLLFSIMTQERWGLLRQMVGAGPLGIEDLARRLDRPADGVYADVLALLDCGVLYSTEEGRIIFPFSGLHIDVMLEAAA